MRLLFSLLSNMLSHRKSTLFITTSTDAASLNIYNHLVSKFQWATLTDESAAKKIYRSISRIDAIPPVYMWLINEPTIHVNYPEAKFIEDFRKLVSDDVHPDFDEILFLSRHAAASGTVSLTVHSIGIPWQDDAVRSGGIPGRCTPPSSHIASLYRSITSATRIKGLDKTFQTSLEATHHGPYSTKPCCFVEIGSSETEWSNPDAGEIWAMCLGAHFYINPLEDALEDVDREIVNNGLEQDSEEDKLSSEQKLVIILIGGGHYIPKMSDIVKLGNNVYVGHALATYALEEHLKAADGVETKADEDIPRWQKIITEAVESTRISFPVSCACTILMQFLRS
ncbi:hypothetical protein EON65_31370 [archaeon]|nr:MAG: hypothetical protein EON65_31370 [archaeon]